MIAAIAVIVVTGGAALGPILTILVEAAKGLVAGAVIGGLIGGLSSVAAGGSFFAGFDLLSLGVSLFDSKSPLVQFNKKLHSSSLYNGFQLTVSTLAIFTAGFTKGMKNPICFVGFCISWETFNW